MQEVILALLASSALWGFLQFIISRRDKRSDKLASIEKKLDKFDERLDGIEYKMDSRQAENRRFKILRFADEIKANIRHSGEHYIQMLDTIEDYNNYCQKHPDFRNGHAVDAIRTIQESYERHKGKGDI